MSAPRIFLVGESNPYGSDPAYALYPLPAHATGGRLAKVLGLRPGQYIERFERRNLMEEERWSIRAWRVAADDLLREVDARDRLVLLGARVAAAFGVGFRENVCQVLRLRLGTDVQHEHWTLVIPHPSGRSREWNDPSMSRRVREAFEDLGRAGLTCSAQADRPRALEETPTVPDARPAQFSDLSAADRSELDRFARWVSARARWIRGELSSDEFAAAERELYPNGLGSA